ncbi:MAG: FAD-dependent oxidoreductase, partial [Patescibacteria group bacterium]
MRYFFGKYAGIIYYNIHYMRIAVLGGGITGLTAAYFLGKKGHQVSLFEKEKILGGLAAGFKQPNWNWYLERTYHHLFANDNDILNFAREVGFGNIFFQTPETASLYEDLTIHPLDTPIDFLKFPHLDLFNKLRAGSVLAFLKLSPFFPFYEKETAEGFLKKTMGKIVWNKLWRELFRKKFGDYAGIILASFIWARIKKRTKN